MTLSTQPKERVEDPIIVWILSAGHRKRTGYAGVSQTQSSKRKTNCNLTMEYTGKMLDGQMHGQGKLVYENGECYNGEWVKGVYELLPSIHTQPPNPLPPSFFLLTIALILI